MELRELVFVAVAQLKTCDILLQLRTEIRALNRRDNRKLVCQSGILRQLSLCLSIKHNKLGVEILLERLVQDYDGERCRFLMGQRFFLQR
jgi:hypothetical protein